MGLDSASRERDPTATAVQINVFKRQQTPVNVNNLLSFRGDREGHVPIMSRLWQVRAAERARLY
jgi:hypothetical protein